MYQITFQFENNRPPAVVMSAGGVSLLEAARGAGIALDAPCSGSGSCGKCRVRLIKGQLHGPKTGHISEQDYQNGWRLSCRSTVLSDVTVFVPDTASAYQGVTDAAELYSDRQTAAFASVRSKLHGDGGLCGAFRSIETVIPAPNAAESAADHERVQTALKHCGFANVRLCLSVLKKLPEVLRENAGKVFFCGEEKNGTFTAMDVTAEKDLPMLACALDVGTTTVSGVLADLQTGEVLAKASAANAQIRFGADVISRIIEQQKPDGVRKLQDAVIKETVTPLIETMLAGISCPPERIMRVSIAANSTMNHLLLGVNAAFLRTEPYIPAFFRLEPLQSRELCLPANPDAAVLLAPNIGSYVGGDITAGIFVSDLWQQDEVCLFIDLGTNGELVFGNREFMLSCACSAGPAFEGGDISCGMRAADGAIEAVSIDEQTMEPTLGIIGGSGQKPVGICGSGIIDLIAELYRTGIISPNGDFIRTGRRIFRDALGMRRYVLAFPDETQTGREISVTGVDIVSFIRAKGAVFSAIQTMLGSVGMDSRALHRVYVAGGIGSGINMENAVRIGMLPDIDRERFRYIGNAALCGAYAMALSDDAAQKVAALAEKMTYLELSTDPGYMDAFVAACFLPHTDAELFPSAKRKHKA